MPNPTSGNHPNRNMMTAEDVYHEYIGMSVEIKFLKRDIERLTKDRDEWKKYALEVKEAIEKYLRNTDHLTRL